MGAGDMSTKDRAAAYVFDLDGTLATIPVDWDGVREGVQEIIGEQLEFKHIFPTIGDVIAKRPESRAAIMGLIDRYELAAIPSTRLYPGTPELLSKLSEDSKLALVTMQGRRACSQVLEIFGLKQYFLRYFTREDSMDRAEQFKFAMSSIGASKTSTILVGDRLNDLNAAKKVGARFTMIRTHGDDPEGEDDVQVYHSVAEFLSTLD
jgi:phosphoglycolate phosphatase-like HAD superfamily hydrolase